MPETGNALSRNPNLCASCSSMADGMDGSTAKETVSLAPEQAPQPAQAEALEPEWRERRAAEPAAYPSLK